MKLKFWSTDDNHPTEEQVDEIYEYEMEQYGEADRERIRQKLDGDSFRIKNESVEDVNEAAKFALLNTVVDSNATGGGAVSAPHIELHVENLVVTDPELFAQLFSVAEDVDS